MGFSLIPLGACLVLVPAPRHSWTASEGQSEFFFFAKVRALLRVGVPPLNTRWRALMVCLSGRNKDAAGQLIQKEAHSAANLELE